MTGGGVTEEVTFGLSLERCLVLPMAERVESVFCDGGQVQGKMGRHSQGPAITGS